MPPPLPSPARKAPPANPLHVALDAIRGSMWLAYAVVVLVLFAASQATDRTVPDAFPGAGLGPAPPMANQFVWWTRAVYWTPMGFAFCFAIDRAFMAVKGR